MLIFDVLFYYYFRLYSLSKLDDEPTFTARLVLTASESLLIIGVLDICSAYFFSKGLNRVQMIIITLIILLLNTFVILNNKRVSKILNIKPKLFNSDKLSLIFTLLFLIGTISIMFWLGGAVDYVITNYR